MKKNPFFWALLFCFIWASSSWGASVEEIQAGRTSANCPNKVLGTAKIEGYYTGWYNERIRCVGIQTADGRETIFIAATKDAADKIFGNRKGKPFSVTYKIQQNWWDYEKRCSQFKILVSAKQISALKTAEETASEPEADTAGGATETPGNPENMPDTASQPMEPENAGSSPAPDSQVDTPKTVPAHPENQP